MVNDRDVQKPVKSAFVTNWEISQDYNTQFINVTDMVPDGSDAVPVVDYTDEEIDKIASTFVEIEPFYKTAKRTGNEELQELLTISARYFALVLRTVQEHIKSGWFYKNTFHQVPIIRAHRQFLTADPVFLEFYDRFNEGRLDVVTEKYFLTFISSLDQVNRMTLAAKLIFEVLILRGESGVRAMIADPNGGFALKLSYRMWQNTPYVVSNSIN